MLESLTLQQSLPLLLQAPESVARILRPVGALWGLKQVEQYLGWYLSEGMLKPDVGKAVSQHIRWVVQTCQLHLNAVQPL